MLSGLAAFGIISGAGVGGLVDVGAAASKGGAAKLPTGRHAVLRQIGSETSASGTTGPVVSSPRR